MWIKNYLYWFVVINVVYGFLLYYIILNLGFEMIVLVIVFLNFEYEVKDNGNVKVNVYVDI